MAQVTRSPKSWSYADVGNLNYYIGVLRNNIKANAVITYSDLQTLINLINNAIGHYHTYDDAYQLATYGNNGDRNNYYRDTSTYTAYSVSGQGGMSGIGGVSTSTTITAAKHNEMAYNMRVYGYHTHQIDDRTG